VSVSGPTTSPVTAAITALRAAGESGDANALAELFAADVVFHSPISARIRFEGREDVTALHRDIFAVLENIETTEPLTHGDTGSFSFRARVRGVALEAMNLVRVNEQGQIVECTVYARPLPGLARPV
jgi:SnoaL-like domain